MAFADKNNEKIGAVNRGTPCESGLCGFCRVDCQGRCETWLSSMLGRRTLVPKDYGNASIGSDNTAISGDSYNALRIRGNGKEEHQHICEFIRSNLEHWQKEDGINQPDSE